MPKNEPQTPAPEAPAPAPEAPATAPQETKPAETKRQAFVRLAQKRTTNASHAIEVIIPLTNKANYDFTDKHWEAVLGQLAKSFNKLKDAIQGKGEAADGFDLGAVEGDEPSDNPGTDNGEGDDDDDDDADAHNADTE